MKKLHQLQHDFLTAAPDKSPIMKWGDTELRRYRNQLYVMPCLTLVDAISVTWDLKSDCLLPIGRLTASHAMGQGNKRNVPITVRTRTGGERCYLGKIHRSLKNLFQEWRVPPWERDRIPLLYSGD